MYAFQENKLISDVITSLKNSYVLPILFSFIVYFFDKKIFFIIMFILIDYMLAVKKIFTKTFNRFVQIMNFGIFLLSYKYGILSGLILIAGYLTNRIIALEFDKDKIIKVSLIVVLSLLFSLAKNYNFIIIFLPIYLSRYLFEAILFRSSITEITKMLIRTAIMFTLVLILSPILLSIM